MNERREMIEMIQSINEAKQKADRAGAELISYILTMALLEIAQMEVIESQKEKDLN